MAYSLKSVAKGSLLYTAGQVLTRASAFLLIPLYTRFLTPDDYGIVGYMQFLLQILAIVLMFGFYGAQARFFYQHKQDEAVLGEYLFSINVWLVGILVPGILLVFVFGKRLYGLFGPDDIPFHPYVPIIALATFFQVMNQMTISYWMVRKKYGKTTLLQFLQFLLLTSFSVFLVVGLDAGAEGKIRGLLYGHAAFFLCSYPQYARHFLFRFRLGHVAFSLGFGLPIAVHLVSGVVHNSIDRAILADRVSVADLGLYTLGYQVGMVMNVITNAVNNAWQPSYYDLMGSDENGKDHQVQSTYRLWMVAMSIVCMVGVLWCGDVLKLLTPAGYHGAGTVVPYVLLGYFFHGLYYFASAPIFYYKKTYWLPWLTGAAAALNILLNLWFIPLLGIQGAALATTVSMLVHAVFAYIVGRRIHDHGFNLPATGAVSAALAAAVILFQWTGGGALPHLYRLVCLLALAATVAVVFHKDLRRLAAALNTRRAF